MEYDSKNTYKKLLSDTMENLGLSRSSIEVNNISTDAKQAILSDYYSSNNSFLSCNLNTLLDSKCKIFIALHALLYI